MKIQALCKDSVDLFQTFLLPLLLITALIPFSRAETSQATTWIVDENDPGADFSSINAAIIAAESGDTVYVRSGQYYEHVLVNKSIQLVGENTSAIIDGNFTDDVVIVTANDVAISGFTIQNSGKRTSAEESLGGPAYEGICGIYLKDYNGIKIIGNALKNNFVGISIERCSNILVSENLITESYGDAGIRVAFSSSLTISENSMTLNDISGAVVYQCSNSVVTENQIVNNVNGGIVVCSMSNHIAVSNNNISENDFHGLNLVNAYENSVYGNNMSYNYYGVCFSGGENNTVYGNHMQGNYYAFAYYDSPQGQARDNELVNNVNDEYISTSVPPNPTSDPFASPAPSSSQLTPNPNSSPSATPFIPGNGRTIVVPDDFVTIQEAIDSASDGDTILVKQGTYEGPQNQTTFINKTISFIGEGADNSILRLHPPLVPMNIFTYEYMGYLDGITINADGVRLSGFTIISDGGDLSATGNGNKIIGNHMNFRVSAIGLGTQILGNTLKGVIAEGSNQTITQNTISEGTGEFLISCSGSYNTIAMNKVVGSTGGIYTNGSYNIVHGNSVTSESYTNAGLEVNGNENIVYRNNISSSVYIGSTYVPESSSNIVRGNTIGNYLCIVGNNNIFDANYLEGIVLGNRIQDASNNIFYRNSFDFKENEVWYSGGKVFTVWEGVKGSIFLDDGKIGNYYSDYNGSDLNSDGVGDTPYVITAKDPSNYHNIADFNIADMVLTDHYPLMVPFDISSATMELPEWEYLPQLPLPTPSLEPPSTPSPPESPLPLQTTKPTVEKQGSEAISTIGIAAASGASLSILGLLVHSQKRSKDTIS